MQRVQAYQEKWLSHPIVVEPHMGEDGYLVIEMPEGWVRKD